jgi:hypothetical protein
LSFRLPVARRHGVNVDGSRTPLHLHATGCMNAGARGARGDERWPKMQEIKACIDGSEVYTDDLLNRKRCLMHAIQYDIRGGPGPARSAGRPQESTLGATGHPAHHHHAIQPPDPESGHRPASHDPGTAGRAAARSRPAHHLSRFAVPSVTALVRRAGISYDLALGKPGRSRMDDMNDEASHDDDAPVQEARLWQGNGWTARVIKNDDDDGWAVAMYKDGEPSPRWSAPGPWAATRRTPSRWTSTPSTR